MEITIHTEVLHLHPEPPSRPVPVHVPRPDAEADRVAFDDVVRQVQFHALSGTYPAGAAGVEPILHDLAGAAQKVPALETALAEAKAHIRKLQRAIKASGVVVAPRKRGRKPRTGLPSKPNGPDYTTTEPSREDLDGLAFPEA